LALLFNKEMGNSLTRLHIHGEDSLVAAEAVATATT